jgi:hypothetical protein
VVEHVEGQGLPLGCCFSNALASSFLLRSTCCRVKPLNCLLRLSTAVRYCMSVGSFAKYSFSTWPATTLESVLTMHVVTPSARNLRSPRMTTSYYAMLLVHLSDSKAKLRRAAYLYLTPAGDIMIAAAPAPAWHHAPSQWMVQTFSGDSSCHHVGPIHSTMKSARTCDLIAVLGSKVMWYPKSSAAHLAIWTKASGFLNNSPRPLSKVTRTFNASK